MMTKAAAKVMLPVSARDHIAGPERAPVTLVEYGDYECPYCGQAFIVVQQLEDLFKVLLRVVFRHFPLTTVHPHAQHSAEAAEAAGAQDQFWEMHDYLFEHQQALDDEALIGYADELGLDMVRFRRDMAEHRHAARIRDDVLSGIWSGVNGTPSFFINGVHHDGFYDSDSLGAAITEAAEEENRKEGQVRQASSLLPNPVRQCQIFPQDHW
jgi:protein-disulfide isomerase